MEIILEKNINFKKNCVCEPIQFDVAFELNRDWCDRQSFVNLTQTEVI